MTDPDVDLAWRPLAEATRRALLPLGWEVPDCLPGEREACGGGYAEHTAAHLAALKALVEYRISHLGAGAAALVDQVYTDTLEELRAGDDHTHGA